MVLKGRRLRFTLLSAVLLFFLVIPILSGETFDLREMQEGTYVFFYEEHYYHGVGESSLTINKRADGYTAVWKGITDTTEVYADLNYNTYKIVFTDISTSLTVERKGNILLVKGVDSGKRVKVSLEVGSSLWIQLLPFSLIPFTTSEKKVMDFFLFDPYNIKVRNMRIEKKGLESVTLFGKEYPGVKMAMRMKGVFSAFWKSEIWNDTESGIQLKYEGLNVIPKMYKAKILLKRMDYLP